MAYLVPPEAINRRIASLLIPSTFRLCISLAASLIFSTSSSICYTAPDERARSKPKPQVVDPPKTAGLRTQTDRNRSDNELVARLEIITRRRALESLYNIRSQRLFNTARIIGSRAMPARLLLRKSVKSTGLGYLRCSLSAYCNISPRFSQESRHSGR